MTLRKLGAALVVYVAALAHGLAVVSYPASAAVLKAHALSDAAYGTIFLPQMLGTLLGSLLGGRSGGSRARTLAASLMAAALAEVVLYATPSAGVTTAWLGTTALGLGFGLAAAPLNALPGELFPRQAESALVLLHSLLACGFALGPLLVARAIDAHAWPFVAIGIGALAALLSVMALFALPNAAAERRTEAASGASSTPWRFVIIVVLYALAEGTFANWTLVYLREERAIDQAAAALALAMFWFALTLGRLTVSALVRVIPAAMVWCALPLAMLAAFLALPLVMTPEQGIAAFALAGLACSAFFPLSVSLAGRSLRGGTARASSLLTAALMIGVGIGSFVIGPLRAASSIAGLYRVSALYPLLAFVLCVYALRAPRNTVPGAGVVTAEE